MSTFKTVGASGQDTGRIFDVTPIKSSRFSPTARQKRIAVVTAVLALGFICGVCVFSPAAFERAKTDARGGLGGFYFFSLNARFFRVVTALAVALVPAVLTALSAYSELGRVWRAALLAASAFFSGNATVTLFYCAFVRAQPIIGGSDPGRAIFSIAFVIAEAALTVNLAVCAIIAEAFHEYFRVRSSRVSSPFRGGNAKKYLLDVGFLLGARILMFVIKGLIMLYVG